MASVVQHQIMFALNNIIMIAFLLAALCSCKTEMEKPFIDPAQYPGVPKSDIYEVTLIRGDTIEELVVFKNSCPVYQAGKMNMAENDQYPLNVFAGRSIH